MIRSELEEVLKLTTDVRSGLRKGRNWLKPRQSVSQSRFFPHAESEKFLKREHS